MTDPWRPLPIPMLPANEGQMNYAEDQARDTARMRFEDPSGQGANYAAWLGAKAERDALEMMERAKAMMRENER